MKRYFFLLSVFASLFISCEKENTPPEQAELKPIGESVVLFDHGLIFSSDAGNKEITFSTNKSWTATILKSGEEEWCKLSILSGSAGEVKLVVSVLENTSYEDREKNIIIQVENVVKTITVKQKNKDALIISNDKFDVDQLGGIINVELKSNVDYSVIIPDDFKNWILQSSTRSLTIDVLNFEIARNDGTQNRSGKIIIKSTSLSDTVFIDQRGGKFLEIPNEIFTLSSTKDTIEVEVISNLEFEVLMPTSETWIKHLTTKKENSKSTIYYEIDTNNTYTSRKAEIIYYEKDGDLAKKITIIQAQKEAIIVSKSSYDVNSNGGELEITLLSNIDFEVIIPSDATWLSLKEIKTTTTTDGLSTKKIYLTILGYTGDNSRYVVISLSNSSKNISESITINQSGTKDVYWGDLTLSTLQEFQNFENSGFKKIVGNLYIKANSAITGLGIMGTSLTEVTGDIYINGNYLTDLLGLSSLTKVGSLTIDRFKGSTLNGLNNLVEIQYNLELLNECRPLNSFMGLNKLQKIGGSLNLIGNTYDFHELRSFNGLENLEYIGNDLSLRADFIFLESFQGLNKLREIGGNFKLFKQDQTSFRSFDSLTDFNGLNSLETVGGRFDIYGSFDNLVSFEGLERLTYVGGSFFGKGGANGDYSSYNSLVSFKGLENLKVVGGGISLNPDVSSFNSLISFEGLGNIEILDYFHLGGNSQSFQSLLSFNGFNGLKEIKQNFSIGALSNSNIKSLDGFNNLSKIGGYLNLSVLPFLVTLRGLENLKTVNQYIDINNCDRLSDISDLIFLSSVGNNTTSSYYNRFNITNCPRLFDFCALSNMAQNFTGSFTLTGNGFNPTLDQIKKGECKSQ